MHSDTLYFIKAFIRIFLQLFLQTLHMFKLYPVRESGDLIVIHVSCAYLMCTSHSINVTCWNSQFVNSFKVKSKWIKHELCGSSLPLGFARWSGIFIIFLRTFSIEFKTVLFSSTEIKIHTFLQKENSFKCSNGTSKVFKAASKISSDFKPVEQKVYNFSYFCHQFCLCVWIKKKMS